ncbi:hypothetical protein LWI29_023425 [Acer saccharum]|uniref:Uncharacterized protein n=1 Tax=Acer saccharum TaxID=4024 RepID=A0AA39VI26_ACESA|nr:hypothetical protein LWI29_023425 [Acer saccharum]KAK1557312.1 hypothetical protein Q3G72_022303 [Acer saccharum]
MIKGRKIPTKAVSERDDQDLVLFRDLHRREKDRMSNLLQPVSDDFEPNPAAGNFALYRMASGRKGPGHEFFAENDKNDYDWLKTPPATPLFPSLEMEANAPADRLILQRDIPILQPLSRSRFGSDSATKGASKSNTNGRPKSPKPKPKPTMRYVTPTQNSLTQTNNKKPTISSTSTNPKTNTKPTNVIGNTSRVVHMDFLSSNISKNSSSSSSNIVTKTKGRSRGVSPSSTRSSTLIIPTDIPGFSNETPPNLMTDISRSTSATRGRPTAAPSSSAADHINRSTSATRRQSRSPSVTRGRKPTTEDQIQIQAGKTSIAIRNSNSIGTQFLGSRMVDKLMNARSKSDRESSTTTTRPKSRGSVSAVTTPNKMMSRTSLDNHIMVQETKRDRNGSRQLGKSSTRE